MKHILYAFCLLTLASGLAAAQEVPAGSGQGIRVTGTVTSKSDGSELPGVNVVLKGSNTGTSTGIMGEYSITVPSAESVLIFSMVGMVSQEITVGNQTTLNVSLEEDSKTLGEVVVIGYGTAAKRDLTGSIVAIKGGELADKPSPNLVNSLQGRVAGLSVVNSGRPGAEPDVRIRGTNTINGVKPIYIVDGILNDNINFVNPADIESVEILKDPSSLAIFGVRGANGAIAITTKKAKAGQIRVNVNSTIGIKEVSDRISLTNAAEFKELYNEQLANQNSAPFDYTYWTADTDWQDQIFQKALLNYNNVSITGATEKNRFYMGIGTVTEEGMIKHEKYNKLTININDEFEVSKNLKFGFTLNGYRASLPVEKGVGAAIVAAPIAPVMDQASGLYLTLPDFQRAQVYNPLVAVELQKNTAVRREYRAVGSIFGEVKFWNDLTFRAQLYADYGVNTNRSYQPLISVYNPEIEGEDKVQTLVERTSVSQSQNIYPKLQQDYLLTYTRSFDKHNLTVLGGFTSYYNGYENTYSSVNQGSSFPIPNDPRFWYADNVGDPSTKLGGGSAWENATLSYLARALYNYEGRYLVNASFRRDGSSAFRGSGRWQNFAAVGLGWVVSEETFFKNQNFIDYLKIKASWGILGNQNIDDRYRYPAYPTLTAANSGVFGDNIVAALQNEYIADPNLHWETVHAKEAGFELNSFKNRLTFEFNYYDKLTKDILVIVPGIAGTTPGLSNLGEVSNRGVELSASWDETMPNGLSYGISGNFTTFNNKVRKLSTTGYQIINGASRTTEGFPIGYFWGYKVVGVYQTEAEFMVSPASSIGEVYPGDLKYADVNGDGFITEDDRTMIGNPTPDFSYGISANVGYKGFDISIEGMGVYGNEIFRQWNKGTYAQFNYLTSRMNRWHGVGTSNWEPILHTGRANNYQNSSYWIEDGSFFRIRNIQIGYNFPTELLEKIKLKSLRLYLNVQNLKTFTYATGFTPEIGGSSTAFGVDNGTYPIPRIYTFGINFNF